MTPIRLMAIACPYGHLDHNGHAQHLVPFYDAPARRVGGELCNDTLREDKVAHYRVSADPVELICPDLNAFAYYRRFFHEGQLLAADQATAKKVGVKFADPRGLLAAARVKAVAEWQSQNGTEPELHKPRKVAKADAEPEPAKPWAEERHHEAAFAAEES